MQELNNKEKMQFKKEIEFSEKIDELNQETDTLLDEIDTANVTIKFNGKEFLLSRRWTRRANWKNH